MVRNGWPTFHALLVEGVPGIGKSTLIDSLIRRYIETTRTRQIRTFLNLTQTYTYGPLAPAEDAGTLSASDNLHLLERIVQTLEWLHGDIQFTDKPVFIFVDCLHLTHCLRPGVVQWTDVEPFDRRLARLGCKLVLLTASEKTIWERSIQGRDESQFLKEYAHKFGCTHKELHEHFIAEQEKFLQMFEQTALSKLRIQADGDLSDMVHQAQSFWLS